MKQIDDSTLLKIEPATGTLKFISLVVSVPILLTLCWNSIAPQFIKDRTSISFTTTESNTNKAIRALTTRPPRVVIVGTSVADRLEPIFFEMPGVMNLAFPGGSSLTGLEILVQQGLSPSIVLIETNYLANAADKDLVFKTNGSILQQIISGSIKPFRYLVTRQEPPSDTSNNHSQHKKLLSAKPTDYHNNSKVIEGAAWYESEDGLKNRQSPNRSMHQIINIADFLESKGVRVFYVHFPLAEAYEDTSFFRANRKAISGNEQYECPRCLDLKKLVNADELRWVDGVHLDNRSAILLAHALEKHLTSP